MKPYIYAFASILLSGSIVYSATVIDLHITEANATLHAVRVALDASAAPREDAIAALQSALSMPEPAPKLTKAVAHKRRGDDE